MSVLQLSVSVMSGYLGHRILYPYTGQRIQNRHSRALIRYGLGCVIVLFALAMSDRKAVAPAAAAMASVGAGVVLGYLE